MKKDFLLQDPGEGIHEVEVLEILVREGQSVEDGDTAFVVESDKAAIELPAPYDGTVAAIAVEKGQTIRVGDVLMSIETADEAVAVPDQPARATEPAAPPTPEPSPVPQVPAQQSDRPIKAAPTARKLAKQHGIDLGQVTPSGSKGHVTCADVQRHVEGTHPSGQAARADTIEPLRSIRKATALHMARAWAEIPHVMVEDKLDLTDLERLRRCHAAAVKEQGGQLTLMVFALKALAACLRDHPRFNAQIDMAAEQIVLKGEIALGVALDSARGLIVPVLRGVAEKSVFDIACDLKALADRVRGGAAAPADLKGASFTVTNIGALGGTGFSPIINHPEVAILGLGRGELAPVIKGDLDDYVVEARYQVPVGLSFDHRVNDGADAARFLADFKARFSDPGWFAIYG